MIMQMLEAGGLETVTDATRIADDSNPRGYFELERVKALETGDHGWVAGARGKGVKVIAYLLNHLPSGYNYRVIFIVRNLEEVLASQTKMLTARGEEAGADDGRMSEILYDHVAGARRLLEDDPRFQALYVRHDVVISGPQAEAARIARFVGRRLDVAKMASVVDPDLHRNRAGG